MPTQKKMLKMIFGLSVLSLAGCSNTVQEQSAGQAPDVAQVVENRRTESTCPILHSDKWYAWLDKEASKEGQFRLNVSGEITLPNPGFELEWSVGLTDRMRPPGLRLSLVPKSLNQMTIQVLTNVPVKYYMDTPIRQFRHVSIYCGQQQLAQIVDVMLTD
jgi:hypothetical protein